MGNLESEMLAARLQARAARLRDQLRLLPSISWAKDATNRKRVKLAAQLRQVEDQLLDMRQIGLFPRNLRRESEDA